MANFIIGTTDFSAHVIAGTYSVINRPVYVTWADGDGHSHRKLKREKISGSFDMFFKTMEEYQTLITAIEASKVANSNSYVTATLTDNYSNTDATSKFYIDFAPVRDRDANWKDYFGTFTVSIEEY